MFPSTSAYTRFCAGTSNRAAAARNRSQPSAWSSAKIASAVRPGVRAVQASATSYVVPSWSSPCGTRPASRTDGSTSERIGPCRVDRIVSGTSAPPRTRMVSVRVVSGSVPPSRSTWPPTTRSRYRSVTSGARLVKPHATRALCPITTPGRPAKVNPVTSNGQSALVVRQCRPIWYQVLGACSARCGSLASSGRPVVVNRPDTTQAFEPRSPPRPSRAGTASSARPADLSTSAAAGSVADHDSVGDDDSIEDDDSVPDDSVRDDSSPDDRVAAGAVNAGSRDALSAASASVFAAAS